MYWGWILNVNIQYSVNIKQYQIWIKALLVLSTNWPKRRNYSVANQDNLWYNTGQTLAHLPTTTWMGLPQSWALGDLPFWVIWRSQLTLCFDLDSNRLAGPYGLWLDLRLAEITNHHGRENPSHWSDIRLLSRLRSGLGCEAGGAHYFQRIARVPVCDLLVLFTF